jgi:hypothetical protein
MSSSLAANAGSVERLKVRRRCGWSSWSAQMRWTERRLIPAALAIARPVQWVASPGGSAQVCDHLLHSRRAQGRLAGLARGVVKQAIDPGLHEAPLPAPHRGPAPPARRATSATVGRSAEWSTIRARITCFWARLRSATIASKRARSCAETNRQTI